MHHSEVIKLVEKFLADPKSVPAEELRAARDAVWADADVAAWADIVLNAVWPAAYASTVAACAATARADTDYWTDKAKKHVAKYYEITGVKSES
jgi:hypothetical protein